MNSGIYNMGVLSGMKLMEDNSIDCIITSPPYWQLWDYGYPGQWGLEPTYQEYLEHLWQFMDECKRVLKKTGTAWINLGDTDGGSKKGNDDGLRNHKVGININKNDGVNKCLLLIPHRFAIGCIDRGWIMRNDIIWAKRNGMPESCQDRFSKKHEYFFFMAKNQKYYFDLDGIRIKTGRETSEEMYNKNKVGSFHNHSSDLEQGLMQKKVAGFSNMNNPSGKNPGTVSDFWDVTTKGSSEKHYASFNFKLIEKCIVAGCPEGGTVLDPFCGTGTTLVRALQLNRKVIGIDASKEYCEIAEKNLSKEMDQIKMF